MHIVGVPARRMETFGWTRLSDSFLDRETHVAGRLELVSKCGPACRSVQCRGLQMDDDCQGEAGGGLLDS